MLGHPNPKPPSVLGGENSTIGRDEIPGFRLWLRLRRSFSYVFFISCGIFEEKILEDGGGA